METSSESVEEPPQRNQRSSGTFLIAEGKNAGFESPEPILDVGQ
jgi:hypothetical protein